MTTVRVQEQHGNGEAAILLDLVDGGSGDGQGTGLVTAAPSLLWGIVTNLVAEARRFVAWIPRDSPMAWTQVDQPLQSSLIDDFRRCFMPHAAVRSAYPVSFWILPNDDRQRVAAVSRVKVDRLNPSAMRDAIASSVCRVAVFQSSITLSAASDHMNELQSVVSISLLESGVRVE